MAVPNFFAHPVSMFKSGQWQVLLVIPLVFWPAEVLTAPSPSRSIFDQVDSSRVQSSSFRWLFDKLHLNAITLDVDSTVLISA
jgi:hypothetical protein